MSKPTQRQQFTLADFLGRNAPAIQIVDAGAMAIPGMLPVYEPLLKSGLGRVVGFEPIEEECRKLNAAARKNHSYLPYFIGDGSERTFYLTNTGYTSSLYEPNLHLVSRFNELPEVMQVAGTSTVKTHRLDDIAELPTVDFLKADIQGGELDLIRGGASKIASAVAAEIEVEFVPLYKGQPLFAEIDQEMRRLGFVFHAFNGYSGRTLKPIIVQNNPAAMLNQWLWSDAVYIKDFTRFNELTPEQLLKLATILHDVYGSYDLAALAIQHHEAQTGKDLWKWYMQKLMGGVPERPPLEP